MRPPASSKGTVLYEAAESAAPRLAQHFRLLHTTGKDGTLYNGAKAFYQTTLLGASSMKLQDPRPSKWQLFRIWASVGLQSFGGGASTTLLIQRAFIEKHNWLSIEEFTHLWNLCVITPGINLVALTVLIGRKLGGVWGIVVSLAGLLLPSATITCLLAATFKQIENQAVVQEVLRGVIPATGAIMLLVGWNFALPIVRRGHKEGVLYLLGSSV